ncbi:tryptophan-rich sensory protein [Candidatus Woesearchaeota archaeon]|nr:tryptophan-rich sensory protein [Candidatus Woesearchaeota archaeon]
MNKVLKFIISILIPFIASAIGGFFTASSASTWYVDLVKPSFNPPGWIFGPVWTLLYLLMGFALYLVWINKSKKKEKAYWAFGIQLGLNALWSILFFGLRSPLSAFIEIIFLWASILITIIYFYKINKKTIYLLIPYILWVSFAAVLNISIVILN